MHTIAYRIWNLGIDHEVREITSEESAEQFVDAWRGLQPGQAYRMLQRIRRYWEIPHNGKLLTTLQSNALLRYHEAVKKMIF